MPCVHKSKIILTYIFYRFDEDDHRVELDYPRDMSIWRGIGYHIDAAFQYKDGKFNFDNNLISLSRTFNEIQKEKKNDQLNLSISNTNVWIIIQRK